MLAYSSLKKKSSEVCDYPERGVLISGEKCATIRRDVPVFVLYLNAENYFI
jgi:hypothetical protein